MTEQRQTFYSSSDAAAKIGVLRKRLYYWEQIGVIKPRYERFGSRLYRRYTQKDIDKLTHIKQLLDSGYTLNAAAKNAKERDYVKNRRK